MSIEFVLRFIGGILAGVSAFQVTTLLVDLPRSPIDFWLAYVICSASFVLGYLLTPLLTTRPFFWAREHIYHATSSDVLAGGIGLGFGLVIGAATAVPLHFLPGYLGQFLPLIASGLLGYLGMVTLLTHKQGFLGFLNGRPTFDGGSTDEGRTLLVDTSAIIDGRIADISRTGFLGGRLMVPRFVLEELQHIADSSDKQRRDKGRRGLEVLNRLQKDSTCPLEISDVDVEHAVGVDAKLVRLARTMGWLIITNDKNLNDVARIQGVEVLNVNVLANAVRSVVMNGEELTVEITQEGSEPGQGRAYLEDGTMIVVENGRSAIGTTVDVMVTKVLQTAAGRMVFARIKPEPNGRHSPSSPSAG
jgi:uncharacterized protein YacL